MLQKPELLAPAGDFEKLKAAILYGADAVYLGGQSFSLRAAATNFDREELKAAVEFVHAHGKKLYVTANIYAHNRHLAGLEEYIIYLAEIGVDALIVSDPGVFALAKRVAPGLPLHISTQASTCNAEAVEFWRAAGAERVILGRETSIADCADIRAKSPMELEIFVHGAVCMAYSGRCLLSSYLTGRSGNLGDCAQPCRWKYRVEEEKRPGQYYDLEEDEHGSYIFNSKDLCLLDYLPEIALAGVSSLKIEGRMKSVYYVANVVRVYRAAIDAVYAALEKYMAELGGPVDLEKFCAEYYQPEALWAEELGKISHRHYFTGFAVDKPDHTGYIYNTTYSFRGFDFAGIVLGGEPGRILIEQRNHLALGDVVEIITPAMENYELTLTKIWSEDGEELEKLPHPKQHAWLACEREFPVGSLIRRPIKDQNLMKQNKIHN